MYESLLSFPNDFFADFDRWRRNYDDMFMGLPASIRSVAPGTFPSINIGNTPKSVEIYAFVPGMDPAQIEVTVDHGVLSLSGERASVLPDNGDSDGKKLDVHSRERFSGQFQRAVSLPEDVDAAQVSASYRDGVLHISVPRQESAQPKRITIQ